MTDGGKGSVSRPGPAGGAPEANLLSARGGASASCCMQSRGTGKGRSGRHNLRDGWCPSEAPCALHSERETGGVGKER